MDKVKITREQADAIKLMFAKGLTNSEIISRHIHNDHIKVNGYVSVCNLSLDALINALYIGYEVEETPEDKVRELYKLRLLEANLCKMDTPDKPYYDGICRGINECLEALNIKIEGVNHE